MLRRQQPQVPLQLINQLEVASLGSRERKEFNVLNEHLVYRFVLVGQEGFAVDLLEVLRRYQGQQLLHEEQEYLSLLACFGLREVLHCSLDDFARVLVGHRGNYLRETL